MKNIFYLPILVLVLLSCSHNHSNRINDIIQPINLEEGVEKEIVISDLFYAKHYNLIFSPNENLVVVYDSVNNSLKLKAKDGFKGLDVLEFTFENQQYHIPFKLQPRKKYLIHLQANGKTQSGKPLRTVQ
jgi:hypothetical protein